MTAHTSSIIGAAHGFFLGKPDNNIVARLISRRNDSRRFYMLTLFSLMPFSVFWALSSGAIEIDLMGLLFSFEHSSNDFDNKALAAQQLILSNYVFWDIRLPRVGMTMITGAGLAVCGTVLQTLCRNPLADPGLVGVSSGAALFAAFGIMLVSTHSLPEYLPQWVVVSIVPLFASVGSILALLLLLSIAGGRSGLDTLMLILAGVAINAGAMTLLGFINYTVDDATLRQITFWSMGSYAGINIMNLAIAFGVISVAMCVIASQIGHLMLISTGEKQARFQGLNVSKVKVICLLAVSAIVAVSVSFTGIVGFVGLVVPHICRMVMGEHLRILLPASALLGSILVTCADTLARTMIIPAELPIGLLTSLIGVPFFLYLIVREKRKLSHV